MQPVLPVGLISDEQTCHGLCDKKQVGEAGSIAEPEAAQEQSQI